MNELETKAPPTWRAEAMRLASFAAVGLGGYVVHAGALSFFIHIAGLTPTLAWFPAFFLALAFTWGLNRMFTFRALKPARKRHEAAGYLIVQSLGAVINYLIYALLVITALPLLSIPVIALAGGSGVAFIFNYVALRKFVFHGKSS